MSKKLVLSLACIMLCCIIFAQGNSKKKPSKKVKFLAKAGVGYTTDLQPFFKGQPTDGLIQMGKTSFYASPLTATWFAFNNWGFEIGIRHRINSSKNLGELEASIYQQYKDVYFTSNANYDYSGSGDGSLPTHGYIGLAYRIQKGKWLIIPKANVGIGSLESNYKRLFLKERNSNNHLKIEITPSTETVDRLYLGAGFNFSYEIRSHIYLGIDIDYGYQRANIGFTRTDTDVYTNTVTYTEQFRYPSGIHLLNMGVGVSFRISRKHRN